MVRRVDKIMHDPRNEEHDIFTGSLSYSSSSSPNVNV